MNVIIGFVVVGACFALGVFIGISVSGHLYRRRIHRLGAEHRDLDERWGELERQRHHLVDERYELEVVRRRLLEG